MSRFAMDWTELSLQVMITFGHFLWQACVVGCVLLVVQHVAESLRDSRSLLRLRRGNVSLGETDLRGANIRYTIACVAFFSLPISVIATFAWVHQSRGPIVLVASDPVESPSSSIVSANEAIPTMANTDSPVLPPTATLTSAEVSATKPIEPPTLVLEPQTSPVQRIQAFAPYLLVAYIVGVGFMLARFLLAIIGSSRLRQTIQPITDAKLLKTIEEQCARVGLKRIPIVALCQRVSVPVVVGIVKPMILLPPAILCGLDPNQVAAILSHEIAHIRRYDLIVNLLQRFVEALLFFHPVTWWISRRVSIERENCCDDVAAACMGRLPYAGALLQMAELCIGNDHRRKAALATLSASGSNSTDLGYRIRRLIGAEETTRVSFTRRSISTGMAMISLLTISLVAWGQSQQSANDEKPKGDEMGEVFTPEPLWQTKLAADDVAPETLRLSPVIVAGKKVLSIEKDFDLITGKQVESTFVRLPRKNVLDMTLDPVFRRTSSDREFLVEVSVHGLDISWGWPMSYDIRVLRATDGGQIGTTIHVSQLFDGITSDVDIENGGDFLVLGVGNEVQVYRTETGEVETTMPVKTRRVDAVAISPDLEWLVVSDQNDLHFWRWRDQAPVKTIHMGRKIDSLVFTPDGQYLAEGPDTREDIQIRDMRTLEVIASLKDEVGSPLMVSSMDITPDGRYLVAHNEVSVDPEKLAIPHRIHVWDLQSRGNPVFQIATGEWVRKVEFSDDGRMIVGEFSGAAHGVLLAAWQLPNEIVQRRTDSPIDSKDRLGDGIQWSRFGDENGLLSGARLILPKDGLKPGEPLVVEYRLANVSKEAKTLKCYLNKGMQFTSLSHGNRISGFGLDREREPVTLTIEPGEVFIDTEHLVSIDTTGLEPGPYHAALGSAFFYPDSVKPNTTHELPHRGSIPFTIVGESAAKVIELPNSDIHWGKPIAGLQVGARFAGDPTAYAIDATIEADLFVANVTDQPIECSVVLPHPGDGWLFNVEDSNGSTIMLQRPVRFSSPFPQEYVQLKLAPGEITVLTKDQDRKDGTPSRPRPKFELAGKETDEQGWSDYTVKGRLVTKGGTYSAIFDIVIIRPEIPALRLELDSGNVPFTVLKPGENASTVDQVMVRTADDKAGAMVAEKPADVQNTGALKGRIDLDGVVPNLPKLRVRTPASPWITKRPTDEERKKYEASLVEIDDESIQVDTDQGLANAFVYLAKAPSHWQPTQEDLKPFTLKMQDYRFAPRAAIIRTGQDVRLNNSSVDADNFVIEPMKNDGQNREVGARAEITLKHPFTIPERTPVQAKSQLHPWKTTFLLPLDHPFAAITDSQGKFSIEGLPPGEHQFLIWHERTGWLEKSLVVNIEAGQTKEVNRSYSVDRFRLAANKTQTDVTQQSSAEKPDSSKQSFKLIDGETGKPLQGLKCRAIFAKLNTTPRYQACTTDEHGLVEVVVAKDESAGIAEVPSGWFSNGFGPVYVVVVPDSEQQPQPNAEKKNEDPKLLKLWRGTEVDGRLVWPDKTPAAGVKLMAGVYIHNQSWKEKLGMDLTWYSFDHGDWPNWSRTIVTDEDGKFRVTVPPKDARFWLRIGTTQLGFGPQINVGENEAITQRLAKCVPLEIEYGGSSQSNGLIVHDIPETDDMVLHTGDLQLETGVIVRGRVVDAEGKGLSNVHLTSTGPHGPHSGRSATSGEDGKFEFPAMAAGNLTVHPDARLRDGRKPIPEEVISRDVQAVFVDQSFTIPTAIVPHQITIHAVPHTEVTFEWVDRREDKTQPIAFYGTFRVRGHMSDENGKPATYWTSETERVERDGKQWLTVKIPTQLLKPDLMLAADSKVTASYSDSTGVTSGPGIVELGDITANTTRTIFGDEPRKPESTQGDENDK